MESVAKENGSNGHDSEHRVPNEDDGDPRRSFRSSATMPTSRYSKTYNMSHKNRGMAIIFNHETFNDLLQIENRSGTNIDCDNLERTLKGLDFQVTVHQDLVCKDVMKYVTEAANTNHTDHDCIVICVMSHGTLGMLYAQDQSYLSETLWNRFTADKCPTLAGKPKIFFIQACQGNQLDGGVIMTITENDGGGISSRRVETNRPSMTFCIPIHADFLIGYSTVPGYYSWRNTTRGSWFIQALAEDLRLYGKERDILTLLTFVSQKVAYDFESYNPTSPIMHQQKQIPCITSTLTRLLILSDKNMVLKPPVHKTPRRIWANIPIGDSKSSTVKPRFYVFQGIVKKFQ